MNPDYTKLTEFEYSSEAQITKSKLMAEDIRVMLVDEKTIDTDPLLSLAIGGVKLYVHNEDYERSQAIYNEIRRYDTDKNGNDLHCVKCDSTKVLIAPLQRKNIFYMLFPFFEPKKHICNVCNTLF